MGVSPIASTAITGFSLIADASNGFSTSSQVTGKVYAADYALPTPATMTTAVGDMQTAFTDAAGRTPNVTELGAGNIGGMTLAPGVYKWGTSVLIPADITLSGSATDVWIFEIAQDLTLNSATKVLLAGGALPKNIFWQVSGAVTVGTTAHLEGVVLTQTAVTMATGSSINGRLLAQTAVTLDACTVTSGGDTVAPTVLSNTPLNGALGVPLDGSISATFSNAMDATTLTANTFTLTSGIDAVPVQGSVTYANATAAFLPIAPLLNNVSYTATITTGAKSATGLGLAANRVWSFTTGAGSPTVPTVLSNSPIDGAIGVSLNGNASVTFSEAMDPASFTNSTFTLSSGTVPVLGTVTYANLTAVFQPAAPLAGNSIYTATITNGVKSALGMALAMSRAWSFTTGAVVQVGHAVNLGTAGDFVILAKSGISTVPTSAITGNMGVSPIDSTAITGFSLIADATNVFSTSSQVTGKVYAADYAVPSPSNMTTAVSDMETAFTDAAGRAADVTELGAGNIGGMTLAPGVYKWGTGVLIPTDLTLSGSATDVWIFEIAQDLTLSSAANVFLAGGALPKNIFWQVSGAVILGTTSHLEGVVLSQTMVSLATGASVNGRLLAQTAVTLDGNTVTEPAR